ncbi:MAG: NAD-dependent epimerase/dehydratase family protein [Candidatus Poribacteria bacterium]
MRILVIGSEGTIGSKLVQYLKQDDEFYVKRADRIRIREDDYEMVDITHYETLEPAFDPPPNIVIHLAGEVSRETSEHWPNIAIESNVVGTMNVIKLCLKYNAKLVFAGTSEEYGSAYLDGIPVTENDQPRQQQGIYGLTKWMAEELIEYCHRRYGLNAIIVRLFMCYGPGEEPNPYRSAIARFIDWARRGEPIHVHKGGERSWCYIDDIIEGIVSAMKYEDETFSIFNIGRDEPWDMEDVAKEIIRLTNSNSEIILESAPPGITLVKRGDFSKAEKVLNWKAKTPFLEGLKKTVRWNIENVPIESDIEEIKPISRKIKEQPTIIQV